MSLKTSRKFYKSVKVSPDVHARLLNIAKKGDSFDNVIELLLIQYEQKAKGAKA